MVGEIVNPESLETPPKTPGQLRAIHWQSTASGKASKSEAGGTGIITTDTRWAPSLVQMEGPVAGSGGQRGLCAH